MCAEKGEKINEKIIIFRSTSGLNYNQLLILVTFFCRHQRILCLKLLGASILFVLLQYTVSEEKFGRE